MLVRRSALNELFRDVTRFHDDVNHLFARPVTPPTHALALNVWDDENAVYVEADLPGVTAENLDVQVTEGDILSLQGERKPVEGRPAGQTRFGKFARVLKLPVMVDAEKVEAKLEAGVLTLTLPKAEAAKPRKIAVVAK